MFALGVSNQRLAAGLPVLDFFILTGQSNAEGRGDTLTPIDGIQSMYVNSSGTITPPPLVDPVGGPPSTGSMWPVFGNGWFDETSHYSAFIQRAVGGTPLLPDQAGSNWSPSGSLRGTTVTAANTALAALQSDLAGQYQIGNVYVVWCQGEADAQAVNGTTITGTLYKQALKDLAAYFKAQIPQMAEMLIIQSGRYGTNAQAANWAAIRQAQEDACSESALLRMIYRGAASFVVNQWMVDTVHWKQAALNKAGLAAAIEAASVTPTAIAAAPTILAVQTEPSPDTTSVSTRTVSHTTHASAKSMIVTLHSTRLATNTTFMISGVTFNGIAMKEVWETNTANASPACRVNVAQYYIDEIMYGGPLSGVTADVVCTHSNTANVSDMCIIDVAEDIIPESYAAASATTGTTTTALLTTNGPALVITSAACVSATIDIPTCITTGETEIMDHGLATTKGGSFTVAHETVTSPSVDKSIAMTWSHACSTINQLVVSYRQKVPGE